MDNLKKFATEADYSAATLNYPAVSWVVSGDTVHFDKEAQPDTPKLLIGVEWVNAGEGANFTLYNCESTTPLSSIDDVVFDDTTVGTGSCYIYTEGATYHMAQYILKGTVVGEEFAGELAFGSASDAEGFEMLIPSQVTEISYLPSNNISALVIEATTPPSIDYTSSDFDNIDAIYVPDDAVNTYKATSPWLDISGKIYPISDYSGNLPV